MRLVRGLLARRRSLGVDGGRMVRGGCATVIQQRWTSYILHSNEPGDLEKPGEDEPRPAQSVKAPKKGVLPFERSVFEQSVLNRNMFFMPSFGIYIGKDKGDMRGLFDLGPLGCALQNNIVDLWRRHFVVEEDMMEIDCTSLTPYKVLKSSGHVDRFTDWICEDSVTGEQHRADHLIQETLQERLKVSKTAQKASTPGQILPDHVKNHYESVLARLDSMDGEQLWKVIEDHKITSPKLHNQLKPLKPFNLMFKSTMGTQGTDNLSPADVFLRPETAQGQFVNFNNLFRFNSRRGLPFASASVGKCYRNEIAPRSGPIRSREFLLAEIEHYVDPASGKRDPRFPEVADTKLNLLDRKSHVSESRQPRQTSVQTAVNKSIIDNETLGYFLARIQLFLESCGIDPARLRFRQHSENEMAHYAVDCWDAEVLTSHGWIECVGCADRAAYDLTQHSLNAAERLAVTETLQPTEHKEVDEYRIEITNKVFGPHFLRDATPIQQALLSLPQDDLQKLQSQLDEAGSIDIQVPELETTSGNPTVSLTSEMISINKHTHTVSTRSIVPNVIEPSFGIGRILYAVLEHSWAFKDDGRKVLAFPPHIAPAKVYMSTLVEKPDLSVMAHRLAKFLRRLGISCKIDESGAKIGAKYARADEIGCPVAVTVDFDSLKDRSFTLRDRDSHSQVRATADQIGEAVRNLIEQRETWPDISARLPRYEKSSFKKHGSDSPSPKGTTEMP